MHGEGQLWNPRKVNRQGTLREYVLHMPHNSGRSSEEMEKAEEERQQARKQDERKHGQIRTQVPY